MGGCRGARTREEQEIVLALMVRFGVMMIDVLVRLASGGLARKRAEVLARQ